MTFRQCTDQGLTNYGRKTGQRWVEDFYANLYQCTAPTTRAADWGSGLTFRECRNQGFTVYGPKTGQRWVGDFYANLYHCTAPLKPISANRLTGALRPGRYASPGISTVELSMHDRPPAPDVFHPQSDIPAWKAVLPLDWAADPFDDRNWQFHLRAMGVNSTRCAAKPIPIRTGCRLATGS